MVDATRFLGAWLRAGEGIGWLAAGTMPNSLYRMPLIYLSLTCVFCYSCSFLFVVCVFVFFLCSHWSLVDVLLIFFCPADHVPDWQPRVLLGMVEARSVNVKKTTTTTTLTGRYRHVWPASHLQESTSINFPFSLSAMRTARIVLAETKKNENKRFYGLREANIYLAQDTPS